MKNIRQKKILEIIEAEDIDTQETLISKLEEYGFSVTQTTISRDIRDLNLIKTTSPSGRYKYVAPLQSPADSAPGVPRTPHPHAAPGTRVRRACPLPASKPAGSAGAHRTRASIVASMVLPAHAPRKHGERQRGKT